MDYSIKIRALTGIERADLEVGDGKVALLCSLNGGGKSSIASGVAAALTNRPMIRGITKKGSLGALVRTGMDSASVEILAGENSVRMTWPDGEFTTKGEFPRSSVYAAGVVRLMRLPDDKRAAALMDILKAHPVKQDLAEYLSDNQISDEVIETVWTLVQDHGWDSAHTTVKDKGAKLKGQWEGITGERWGSAKAPRWLPDGYSEELMALSAESLNNAKADANRDLESKIGAAGYSQAQIDQLTETSEREPELAKRHEAAFHAARDADAALTVAIEEKSALPAPPAERDVQTCPHCSQPLMISGGRIVAPPSDDDISATDIADLKIQIGEADSLVQNLGSAKQDADANLAVVKAELAKSGEATKQLAGTTVESAGAQTAIEAAREKIRHVIEEIKAFNAKTSADASNRAVTVNLVLVKALSLDGVRGLKAGKVAGSFNEVFLKPLAEAMKAPPVTIDASLTAFLGTRRYNLLSDGEKAVVDAVVATAVAQTDGSAIVVIDNADTLVASNRSGLIRMLLNSKKPAIVCMAVPAPDKVPHLQMNGLGHTYWLEGGRIELAIETVERRDKESAANEAA